MADVDLNAIAAQRQGIDSRRRPASDFQMTVTDRHGNERTVWNPKVGGEAAYKAQNGAVDKALSDFDNGPLGSLLKTGAQAGITSQAQNQAQIDYHKTPLGMATYVGKEAAPWLFGLPLGAIETGVTRKLIGLGPGSSPLSRGGSVAGGLALSGLEGLLARNEDKHSEDKSLTPFQHDMDEGLANMGYGAAGSNAVGSLISPFIGTGKPSTAKTLADIKPQIEAIQRNSAPPPPTQPPVPPASPNADHPLVKGARAVGAEGDLTPADAKTFIQGKLKSGDLSPSQKIALREALDMSSPQHTFTNALKNINVGALAAAMMGAGYGADAASSGAKAAGLEGGLADKAAPIGGAAAGAGVGYGAYKGLGALARAFSEAVPATAGLIGRGLSRAVPIAGQAMMAHDLASMMAATPRIPDEVLEQNPRLQTDVAARAQYFKELRDRAEQEAQSRNVTTVNKTSPDTAALGASMQNPAQLGYGRQALARALLGQ